METLFAFLKRRKAASDAFVNGDFGPLELMSAQQSPATIFGPKGGCVRGPAQVNAVNATGARSFEPGGSNALETLHAAADNELAYWVGIQRAAVRLQGHAEPAPMALRITEIFRRESGSWKLMHRHADMLTDSEPPAR